MAKGTVGKVKTALLELAYQCEEATDPDGKDCFEINCAIEALIFDNHNGLMRPFTRSVDAATLVAPEGWERIEQHSTRRTDGTLRHYAEVDYDGQPCRGANPALALCAAGLRARAAQVDRNPEGENAEGG